ncbi:MAG: hypothetical protein HY930_06230 [Euryarchaeota archaeon]|nr:hypothetical protein [Euryarchaeota archaeon]
MIEAAAHIKLHFDSEREAHIIYSVLKPELISAPSDNSDRKLACVPSSLRKRASVEFTRRKNEIELGIKAADAASFRAALNSYMRWIMLSKSLIKEELK